METKEAHIDGSSRPLTRRGALRILGSSTRTATSASVSIGLLACLSLLIAVAACWYGWKQERRVRAFQEAAERADFFQAENERLRALVAQTQNQTEEEDQAKRRSEIEKTTAQVRGLDFLKPVQYAELGKEDLGPVIDEKLAEVYTPEQLAGASYAYEVMGMVPEGYDLKSAYMKLLGEQVAAFYDQHKNTLFMFRGSSLSKLQNRIILSHELTHALQDQHFSLEKFPLETADNDDLVASISALVEGDATLLMGQYVLSDGGISPSWDLIGAIFGQQTKALEDAPVFLRESLLFPYMRGQEFCMALWARGGFAAIDVVYRRPPQATSQILHPERYLEEVGWSPRLADWKPGEQSGEPPVFHNVAGEFGLRLLLKGAGIEEAEAIAAGWDGDRYAVYRVGGKPLLIWRTAWRDEGAAERFEAVAASLREHGWVGHSQGAGRIVRVLRRKDEVVVIDAGGSAEAVAAEKGLDSLGSPSLE